MVNFISCDWGTSNLRLRLVDAVRKTTIREIQSSEGISTVYRLWQTENTRPDRILFYLSFLEKYIGELEQSGETELRNRPIIISGMASSSIGLKEIEYAQLPLLADGSGLIVRKIENPASGLTNIYLVSGVSSDKDVMRGEETLLTGCDALKPGDELFILPGTHSKHISVTDGKAERFDTYMTGEFFDLLSRQSILSSSVQQPQEFDKAAFDKGVKDGADGNLLNTAFQVRVNQLFKRKNQAENYHYLSGLLIGAELKDIREKQFSLITVVATSTLIEKYLGALRVVMPGQSITHVEAAKAILNGHCKIFSRLQDS